jgi:hypothetical protein
MTLKQKILWPFESKYYMNFKEWIEDSSHISGSPKLNCPDCEEKIKGKWRTGLCGGIGRINKKWLGNFYAGVPEIENLKDGQKCPNCQGTGSPICCRWRGTGISDTPVE